jgi:hypothetical protein
MLCEREGRTIRLSYRSSESPTQRGSARPGRERRGAWGEALAYATSKDVRVCVACSGG